MSIVQSVFPGFTLMIIVILSTLCVSHAIVFLKEGYRRSKSLALFTMAASYFCALQLLVQSRQFPQWNLLLLSLISLCLIGVGRYNYFKSMSYFIQIPNKVFKSFVITNFILGALSFIPLASYLVGGPDLLFITDLKDTNSNYFTESFTLYVGMPHLFGMSILSLFTLLDIVYCSYLFKKVYRSTKDTWFILGLSMSVLAAAIENLMIPFTLRFYVPLMPFVNMFEALRMSFLSLKEYLVKKTQKQSVCDISESKHNVGHQNNNLNDEKMKELISKTTEVLERTRMYRDANLRLDKLANEVGIPGYLLSQVINNGMNTNFSDLINHYRIENIKDKLITNNRNITDIAFENGFNSKSTFYTSFKKDVGLTPAQYRKKIRSSQKEPVVDTKLEEIS